jgi:hypothetical protein
MYRLEDPHKVQLLGRSLVSFGIEDEAFSRR